MIYEICTWLYMNMCILKSCSSHLFFHARTPGASSMRLRNTRSVSWRCCTSRTSTSCRTLSNIAQGQLATVAEGETEISSAINQTIYVTQGGLTANCFTPLQFWKRRAAMRMKAPKLLYIRPSNLRNLTIRRSRHGFTGRSPLYNRKLIEGWGRKRSLLFVKLPKGFHPSLFCQPGPKAGKARVRSRCPQNEVRELWIPMCSVYCTTSNTAEQCHITCKKRSVDLVRCSPKPRRESNPKSIQQEQSRE